VKAHAGVDAMPIPLPAWRGRFAGSLHGAAAIPEAWEAHVAAASRVDLRQIADELGRVAAGMPVEPDSPPIRTFSAGLVEDRIGGGWLGRLAGCVLGKPMEGVPREGIRAILESSGQLPLTDYITAAGVPDEIRARFPFNRTAQQHSLRETIPESSRLSEAISYTVDIAGRVGFEQAVDAMYTRYGQYHWVHTINNFTIVVLALLHAGGDYERAIGLAVTGGWDTDCSGATVDSIMGTMLGRSGIPAKWSGPLRDRVRSSLAGFDNSSIEDLIRRTIQCVPARYRA
jgi:ADP-ribosylglycohydrolase